MSYEAELAPDAINDLREVRDQRERHALRLLFEGASPDAVFLATGFRSERLEDLFKVTWSFLRIHSRVVLYRYLTPDERLQLGRDGPPRPDLSEALVARIFSVGEQWRMLAQQWIASTASANRFEVDSSDLWTDDDEA